VPSVANRLHPIWDWAALLTRARHFACGDTNGSTPCSEFRSAIALGDLVRTPEGSLAPIKWIRYRTVDARRHSGPHDSLPVRVISDAFAPGKPDRDLYLSPDHAVFVPGPDGGQLIPIRYLLNGASEAQTMMRRFPYRHVEL
jgi:hypothetical protein